MMPGKYIMLLLLVAGSVQAQYSAMVTVNSGNSFVVKQLDIREGRLYSEGGRASTSVDSIANIEFRFSGVGLGMCKRMFRSGDRKALESLLDQYVGPVAHLAYLPGNLGDYLVWRMRVQYWNGNTTAFSKSVSLLRNASDSALSTTANLYFAAYLIDQSRFEDARRVFDTLNDPDQVSPAMAEYIRGRLAVEQRDYRQAMRHIANVIAFHSRDIEWMPPATALEMRVYQETGQLQKAEIVANELTMAYPGTRWSLLGEQLKSN